MELNLFAVLFTLGRLPGWIAHRREMIATRKRRLPGCVRSTRAHRAAIHADHAALTPRWVGTTVKRCSVRVGRFMHQGAADKEALMHARRSHSTVLDASANLRGERF
jgi:hypothetical protein